MIGHILVPLDGSPMAESVLPMVRYLSEVLKAKVTLVHVIEKNAPEKIHGETHLGNIGEAEKYLKEIIGREFSDGTRAEYHVHMEETENVPASIADHVEEFSTDLIVMCSHGRSELRDFVFGNIAQRIISLGVTPVLMMPKETEEKPRDVIKRIMVPLDQSREHEHGLTLAANLAGVCRASLHLVSIVPTFNTLPGKWSPTGRLLPGTTEQMLDMSVAEAEGYLLARYDELENRNLSVTTDVFRGNPADMIGEAAESMGIDLIALGTHGKSGTRAFWSGSVGSQICKSCNLPILLVPEVIDRK